MPAREDDPVIEELEREEADAFLRRQTVGRVGCHAGGSTYVVPVIYVWDGACVYVQSVEGRKIDMMRANPDVCFETDEYLPGGTWRSVIVDGLYEELDGNAADAALALLVARFRGTRRSDRARSSRSPVAFRIRARSVSGRKVERTPGRTAALTLGTALLRARSGG